VLLAADLRRERITPALVLCSPARRARETLEGIAEALGDDGAVRIEPQLYGASAGDLLERLRKIPESVPSVMLIGHNPAIQELAATLAHGDEQVATVERKYPTGALATFALDAAWRELSEATAELVRFVRPKDLR
jgi:phosphohistidine phosphatase